MAWVTFCRRFFRRDPRPAPADFLFVGLGNIGDTYTVTRHNVGFMVADTLAGRFETREKGVFGQADYSRGTLFNSTTALVIKPRTFMNRSGEVVGRWFKVSGAAVSRMLVIVDDYHLPLGKIRARRNGSDGGHKGLASIIEKMGDGFPRLRIGIGPLPEGLTSIDFVLGAFGPAEQELLKEAVLPQAVDACLCFAQSGIDETMNRFNR
ncbi:MAG: aminoacyl-tRNA hydrolase [Chitinispirillaceae bacterium]|nr:aminoacyl-tRNA hydrolase [Chitinispirillaceae bacterium]